MLLLAILTVVAVSDYSDAEEMSTEELRRNKLLFDRLPPIRQQSMRKLDHDLHELPEPVQEQLNRVLERYSIWLSRLDEQDRQRVLTAAGVDRLNEIQQIRERQWEAGLPKAWRDDIAKNPDQRTERIAYYRKLEQQFEEEWLLIERNWDDLRQNKMPLPFFADEFKRELAAYLERLRPLLSPADLARLAVAEQRLQTPEYIQGARIFVDLSDRFPLLPGPATGPKSFSELPRDVQQFLERHALTATKDTNFPGHGRWPDYAIAVSELVARKNLRLPTELGPCRPNQFVVPLPVSIEKLERAILRVKPKDRERLQQAEGHWPDYPRLIMALAKQNQFAISGWTLPGPLEKWEQFRTGKKKLKK